MPPRGSSDGEQCQRQGCGPGPQATPIGGRLLCHFVEERSIHIKGGSRGVLSFLRSEVHHVHQHHLHWRVRCSPGDGPLPRPWARPPPPSVVPSLSLSLFLYLSLSPCLSLPRSFFLALSFSRARGYESYTCQVQGSLTRKKTPTPRGAPQGPRHGPTVGS